MKKAYELSKREQQTILAIHARNFGITFPGCQGFSRPEWRDNLQMACDAYPQFAADAQSGMITTGSSSIPGFLTTLIDPDILQILTAKNAGAEILGEVKKGSFVDQTAMFPVVEHTGEVSSYGDFNNNGRSGANTNFPQRQAYRYQTVCEYGDLELEQMGLAKIGWADEIKKSAITVLNKFQNLTYFYGVAGLQNYGLLNDPSLPTPIAPAIKAGGGLTWFNGNSPLATSLEVYNDIIALVVQLINQSAGNITADSAFILAMSPKSSAALNFVNQYNVTVKGLLSENYPKMEIKTAIQYGVLSAQNPQGSAAGELVQLIAAEVEGQKTGFCAFNEKLRGGPVIRDLSSCKQKLAQGTWGAVIRQPFAFAQMIGV